MHAHTILRILVLLVVVGLFGCGSETDESPVSEPEDFGENPFTEEAGGGGKADWAYLNPDGVEVEVDIEADIDAPEYRRADAPAYLGQFAMTYLRARKILYLESLAEDSSSKERVEWFVDGQWITAADATSVDSALLTRFRIRGINAVLLHDAADDAQVGKTFDVPVPVRPYSIMSDVGDACATPDGHMTLGQSIYWYLWNPERSGCNADLQQMSVTVTELFVTPPPRYPEYDKLIEDGKVTAVVMFGQIGDNLNDSDSGVRGFNRMASWLLDADFVEVDDAPVGRRFTKHIGVVDYEIDLYSPYDFSGLSDMAHYSNFEKALGEHEIVVYDGHSMLGASDFWSRPTYPDGYQIFLYGGCLGYEYYIRPILDAKGGWDNLDIMSSVIEVSADANRFAGPVLADIAKALEGGYDISWNDMLGRVRARVYDSTFGASGVRDNCFTPTGSRCGAPTDPGETVTIASDTPVDIPDNDPDGVSDVLDPEVSFVATKVLIELDVEHTWVGDLTITLEHGGVTETVWEGGGSSAHNVIGVFEVEGFAGMEVSGPWTLHVVDSAAEDEGRVLSWAVILER